DLEMERAIVSVEVSMTTEQNEITADNSELKTYVEQARINELNERDAKADAEFRKCPPPAERRDNVLYLLVCRLEEGSVAQRVAAVKGLGELGNSGALLPLRHLIDAPPTPNDVKTAALEAVGRLMPPRP